MSKAKNIITTTGKVLGTAVVGSVGVMAALMETATGPVPEAKEMCVGIKDGCFGAVKKMWDKKSTADDVEQDLNDVKMHMMNADAAKEALKEYRENNKRR